jgi:hypothetical protein
MGGGSWRNRRTDPDLVATQLLPESKKRRKHSEFVALTLGSGPRGRRFESSRPDQFKIPREARFPTKSGLFAFSPAVFPESWRVTRFPTE